jgi:hypothetical protein
MKLSDNKMSTKEDTLAKFPALTERKSFIKLTPGYCPEIRAVVGRAGVDAAKVFSFVFDAPIK